MSCQRSINRSDKILYSAEEVSRRKHEEMIEVMKTLTTEPDGRPVTDEEYEKLVTGGAMTTGLVGGPLDKLKAFAFLARGERGFRLRLTESGSRYLAAYCQG